MTPQEIYSLQRGLAGFTGTDHYYRHGLMRSIVYTDGVAYLAEHAHAHWLLDIIASYQIYQYVRDVEFQFWKLTVDLEKQKGVVTMVRDEGFPPTVTQEIDYTDFPLPEIELWYRDRTIFLPSEY